MIIGLGNGLSPAQYHAVILTNTALLQVAPWAPRKQL